MHYELNHRSKLNSFQREENSFPKSLNLAPVSVICRVHKNSNVKSLDPCSTTFQTPSHPTAIKTKSNSTSKLVAWRRTGSYADVCTNVLVFNFLKVSFSCLFCQWICFSSSRMLVADDDAPGTSTCMLALALEEELLVDRANPEQASLPTNLFIILQKSTKQKNSWNGLGNKIVSD